ncbi:5-formyltetrahydrofolate cyclo-ligase [Pseudoalteromonas sp. T1lg10]|uniref:5-formyltetrahydrofolate cyclo-ligase n=1 Tax=Pseudoalteromonas sp. T1lg10 TaxID=2077093 RepID=UPI000CF639E4
MQFDEQRVDIRKRMRNLRKKLTPEEQKSAANALKINISQVIKDPKSARVGTYLSNDGEPNLDPVFQWLWQNKATPFLPILHPFTGVHLLFQRYEENSPMSTNRYGILEPELNCSHVSPVAALDFILTPLVAFDSQGNRLGMGGGYYDRTFAQIPPDAPHRPKLIGVAHQCQHLDTLPVASWDVPLDYIVTPERIYCPHG